MTFGDVFKAITAGNLKNGSQEELFEFLCEGMSEDDTHCLLTIRLQRKAPELEREITFPCTAEQFLSLYGALGEQS